MGESLPQIPHTGETLHEPVILRIKISGERFKTLWRAPSEKGDGAGVIIAPIHMVRKEPGAEIAGMSKVDLESYINGDASLSELLGSPTSQESLTSRDVSTKDFKWQPIRKHGTEYGQLLLVSKVEADGSIDMVNALFFDPAEFEAYGFAMKDDEFADLGIMPNPELE